MTGPSSNASNRLQVIIGLGLAFGLTLLSFGLVWLGVLGGSTALVALAGFAVVQMLVHLRCFLHLGLRDGESDTKATTALALVLIAIMVAGTIWIMLDLNSRMGPML